MTRSTTLQLVGPESSLQGKKDSAGLPPLASLIDQAMARLWITNRERMLAINAGRDAFGIAGPLQASNGTQDLLDTVAMLANWLQRNDINSLKTWVERDLNTQEARLASTAADSDVMAEAAMLGAVETDRQIAEMLIAHSKIGADALRTDAIAHHFLQEASRLHAEAAQARAAVKPLQWNKDAYEEFQIKAQYEMILAALPTYYLELKKGEIELGKIDDIVRDLSEQIAKSREAFLKDDGKDIGSIVRTVAVKVVDCVCSFYGLSPLGSLINTAFEGLQAASHGDWNAAFQNFADVAQKSGFTDFMSEKLDKWEEDLGVKQLMDKVKGSDQFKGSADFADKAGIKDAAESYSLGLVNRAAKSILPAKVDAAVDLLLPQSQLAKFSGEELAKRLVGTVSEEGRRLGEAYIRSSGQQVLLSLSDDTVLVPFRYGNYSPEPRRPLPEPRW